jgi:hypothetical protein
MNKVYQVLRLLRDDCFLVYLLYCAFQEELHMKKKIIVQHPEPLRFQGKKPWLVVEKDENVTEEYLVDTWTFRSFSSIPIVGVTEDQTLTGLGTDALLIKIRQHHTEIVVMEDVYWKELKELFAAPTVPYTEHMLQVPSKVDSPGTGTGC